MIEAVPDHDVVVVITDAAGNVSTAGVLTADSDAVQLTADAVTTAHGLDDGLTDMVGYGLHHVLDGADHLVFLITLLLTAPLVVVAGRWHPGTGRRSTIRGVLGIVTAFTIGHSVTLIAAAQGWVHLPTRLIEVLVAASVVVAAAHAVRPLVWRGETFIAVGFGLVHGLAFAGILADLGLDATASVPALLAFNIGVELAQLTVVALLFPSLWLLARTRYGAAVRMTLAVAAVTLACGWVVERVGAGSSPFGTVETTLIAHPWRVVVTFAAAAAACCAADRIPRAAGRPLPGPRRASTPAAAAAAGAHPQH